MDLVRVPAELLRQAVAHLSRAEINETAVPSYTHYNPFIRWLFRRRLEIALDLSQIRPTDRVLDFGTGSGILLPTLHARAAEVFATDLDVSPARTLVRTLALPTHVVPPESFAAWRAEHAGRIDLIMALDVFEHSSADELPVVSRELHDLVAPGGRLVVSGPTETLVYKLGRFIAGFRNVYHYRNVFDIDAQLQARWQSEEARFYPCLPRAFLLTRYVPRPG